MYELEKLLNTENALNFTKSVKRGCVTDEYTTQLVED